MKQRQFISIYRNRKTCEFRIQPFGRLPNGSSQPFGNEERISATVSDERLLKSVLDNLAKNDIQLYERTSAPKISDEGWRRELKEDQLIGISHFNKKYRLVPSRKMRNSFGSIDDMIIEVSEDEFVSRGGEMIRKMFEEIP